ncbi:divalent-cation tolerance protein CutA [Magnetospira thiophila]
MSQVLIYITTADEQEARTIGRALVSERLAACINILPGMTSLYWWEGKLQEEGECVLLAKTIPAHVEVLIARVNTLHGYDCPCVVALPIVDGNPAFLHWIESQVS